MRRNSRRYVPAIRAAAKRRRVPEVAQAAATRGVGRPTPGRRVAVSRNLERAAAGADAVEAIAIIANFMKQPADALSSTFTKADYYRDPFMLPNVPNIQKVIDVPYELGLSPVSLKLEPTYVATEFVEEAKRRIEAKP